MILLGSSLVNLFLLHNKIKSIKNQREQIDSKHTTKLTIKQQIPTLKTWTLILKYYSKVQHMHLIYKRATT